MIKIYKTNPETKELKKIKRISEDSWIDLTSPTIDEINNVVDKTKIDKELIMKMLDEEELPRIEEGDNANLVVIDTPYLENQYEYTTYPLGIIITKNNYVITISPKKIDILDDFKNGKIKNFRTAKKTRFLIQILLKTATSYLKVLKKVNLAIENKEKELKKSTQNKDLVEMLEIEKTLVYFITSLKANDLVLEKLSKGNIFQLYENDADLLDDAIIENKQAIEMTAIYRNILTSITNTYATLVSNNLNIAMKFLAAVTIVLSIPTIISSFLGMNIPLGKISNYVYALPYVLIGSILMSIIVVIILKKKDMF